MSAARIVRRRRSRPTTRPSPASVGFVPRIPRSATAATALQPPKASSTGAWHSTRSASPVSRASVAERGRGAEALDELPVRHAALLEPLARPLVVFGGGLDEKRAPFASADAAAEGLLRRRRRVALPEERLDDHRTAAGRAYRAIELAHRDAVRRTDEGALTHAIERCDDVLARGREGDRAA